MPKRQELIPPDASRRTLDERADAMTTEKCSEALEAATSIDALLGPLRRGKSPLFDARIARRDAPSRRPGRSRGRRRRGGRLGIDRHE